MNFDLSPRAQRMIARGSPFYPKREFRPDPKELARFLESKGYAPDHPAIQFCQQFEGKSYRVRGIYGSDIYLGAGSHPYTFEMDSLYTSELGDLFCCECWEHRTAQFHMGTDQYGRVCTQETILASSMPVFIEGDAVQDSLIDISTTWLIARFEIPKTDSVKFRSRMSALGLNCVPEATDELNSWWLSETMAVGESQWYSESRNNSVIAWCSTGNEMESLQKAVAEWGQLGVQCVMLRTSDQYKLRVGFNDQLVDVTNQSQRIEFTWSNSFPQSGPWIYGGHDNSLDILGGSHDPETKYSPYELEITIPVTGKEREQLLAAGIAEELASATPLTVRFPLRNRDYFAFIAKRVFQH